MLWPMQGLALKSIEVAMGQLKLIGKGDFLSSHATRLHIIQAHVAGVCSSSLYLDGPMQAN